jgi:hypothetical protein
MYCENCGADLTASGVSGPYCSRDCEEADRDEDCDFEALRKASHAYEREGTREEGESFLAHLFGKARHRGLLK